VATFSAHFDESGTPDASHRVLTVAGCVSSVKKWNRFEIAWKKILAEAELPEGTIFHMNRFARNLPPYQHFENDSGRKAALIAALVDCTRRHVHKAVSCTVALRDWECLNRRYQVAESLGYPYSFCGRTCVSQVWKWAKKRDDAEVEFFFEKGARHQSQFDKIMRLNHGLEVTFQSKDSMVQFQAADLLAWKNRKVMTEVINYQGPPNLDLLNNINRSLEGIRSIPHSYGVHTLDSMEKIIRAGKIPRRPVSSFE
jgi:hypothetical protein